MPGTPVCGWRLLLHPAVNENEAREEAQACVYVLNGRQLDYPIYFDTEASGSGSGRADGLGVEDRTKCAVAFCEEVKALAISPASTPPPPGSASAWT